MTNGATVIMRKGKLTRRFYTGEAIEYTSKGIRDVTCPFTTLYVLLEINGWKEVTDGN